MDTQELQRLKNKYDIIGNDAGLNRALEMAVAVGPIDLTVLICGESGVGKDVIPKIIHQSSLRKTGKYFAVNCAAIPEGTVDSELFGHERGSFTGAIEARKGYFEEADGGTLFLDEIGELPLSTQAKLLRVLQSGEYIRVGSSKVAKTDVRVIAATNVNLMHAVSKGKFREDLYYRLSAIQITVPSLRERKDDIYLLFRKFTSDFSEKYSRRKVVLTRDAIEMLRNYRWPGNIRQLQNVANRVSAFESAKLGASAERFEIDAATLAQYLPREESMLPVQFHDTKSAISEDDRQEIYKALYALNNEVAELKKIVAAGGVAPSADRPAIPDTTQYVSRPDTVWNQEDIDVQESDIDDQSVDFQVHKEADSSLSIRGANEDLIRKALEKHHGNRKKAAEELGISERTLYRKLPKEYKKDK